MYGSDSAARDWRSYEQISHENTCCDMFNPRIKRNENQEKTRAAI